MGGCPSKKVHFEELEHKFVESTSHHGEQLALLRSHLDELHTDVLSQQDERMVEFKSRTETLLVQITAHFDTSMDTIHRSIVQSQESRFARSETIIKQLQDQVAAQASAHAAVVQVLEAKVDTLAIGLQEEQQKSTALLHVGNKEQFTTMASELAIQLESSLGQMHTALEGTQASLRTQHLSIQDGECCMVSVYIPCSTAKSYPLLIAC
jgi:hypothetical protein